MVKADVGRFVWFELLSTDPAGSRAFYGELLGWTVEPFGGTADAGYHVFASSQGGVGGVTRLPDQAKAMGAPSYWQANVEVADVDAAVAAVTAAGGKVFVVETVPGIGRFAVIADPQGAVIAVVAPATAMASHDATKHGEFSWHELYTTDHEAAFAFYAARFGWERLGAFDLGPMGTYLLWGRGGTQLGGMMTKPATMPQPPGWLYYVTVDDVDARLATAVRLGAKVVNGPMEVPGGQRVVQLIDPQGAAFALVSMPRG